jgi:hypothetical protein
MTSLILSPGAPSLWRCGLIPKNGNRGALNSATSFQIYEIELLKFWYSVA